MSIDNATPNEWDQAARDAKFAADTAVCDLTPKDIEMLNRTLDRPFGEVPYLTRAYVFLLHQMGKVRVFRRPCLISTRPGYAPDSRYRVETVEAPQTKPSIDWAQIKPEYRWLARDLSGKCYVYETEPVMGMSTWHTNGPFTSVIALASCKPGDCDWTDSLVERPAGV